MQHKGGVVVGVRDEGKVLQRWERGGGRGGGAGIAVHVQAVVSTCCQLNGWGEVMGRRIF